MLITLKREQFLPLLGNVRGFAGVRIHPGNTNEDTDGCILVGASKLATTIGTLVFMERPKQWTFSQRVGGYKRRIDWRAPLAKWICTNLLDPFEAGGHCK